MHREGQVRGYWESGKGNMPLEEVIVYGTVVRGQCHARLEFPDFRNSKCSLTHLSYKPNLKDLRQRAIYLILAVVY